MKAGVLTTGLVLAAVIACTPREEAPPANDMAATEPQLEWADTDMLPSGARLAVVSGNPAEAGPFTFRLRFPDDYRVPPHSHTPDETVTVISGILHLGHGTTYDMSGNITELQAGQSIDIAGGDPHFAHAAGETEIEVRGVGPFDLNYVNPEDDPRR